MAAALLAAEPRPLDGAVPLARHPFATGVAGPEVAEHPLPGARLQTRDVHRKVAEVEARWVAPGSSLAAPRGRAVVGLVAIGRARATKAPPTRGGAERQVHLHVVDTGRHIYVRRPHLARGTRGAGRAHGRHGVGLGGAPLHQTAPGRPRPDLGPAPRGGPDAVGAIAPVEAVARRAPLGRRTPRPIATGGHAPEGRRLVRVG